MRPQQPIHSLRFAPESGRPWKSPKWSFVAGKVTELNGEFSGKPRLMPPEGIHPQATAWVVADAVPGGLCILTHFSVL